MPWAQWLGVVVKPRYIGLEMLERLDRGLDAMPTAGITRFPKTPLPEARSPAVGLIGV